MAQSSSEAEPRNSGAETEPKQPETVLLTAEELRAISGGATGPGSGGTTPPQPKIAMTPVTPSQVKPA